MQYRNLIFDFDGTITDSKRDIARAQLWVLAQLGVNGFREEDLYRLIGRPLQETFAQLLPSHLLHRIPEAGQLYSEYYVQHSLETTRLFPFVRETLYALRSRGNHLAVATTKRGSGIIRATEHFGITECFDQLQGSDGIPFKPDPTIINKIIADQQWDRRETLMVGDTDLDILSGRNAGIATCAVTYGSLSEAELRTFRPDYVIHRFDSLLHDLE